MLRKFLPLFVLVALAGLLAFAMMMKWAVNDFWGSEWDIGGVDEPVVEAEENEETFQESMRRKLNEIRIPIFELVEENLSEAIRKLSNGSYRDGQSGEVVDRAMSFVVRFPIKMSNESDPESERDETPYTKRVSLVAKDQTFPDLMDLICEKFGVAWNIDEFAIAIFPIGEKWTPRRVPVVDEGDPFSGE